MSVDRDVVDYVAGLARLRLDEDEKQALGEQLGRIVEFVETLTEVDISEVPPTKHVIGLANVARPDSERPCLTAQEALANAPEADEDHFVVPKVLPD